MYTYYAGRACSRKEARVWWRGERLELAFRNGLHLAAWRALRKRARRFAVLAPTSTSEEPWKT